MQRTLKIARICFLLFFNFAIMNQSRLICDQKAHMMFINVSVPIFANGVELCIPVFLVFM